MNQRHMHLGKQAASRLLWVTCFLGILFNVLVTRKGFVNFENVAEGVFDEDGFNSQLLHAIRFVSEGFDYSSYGKEGILLFVHTIRLLTAAPFFAAHSLLGIFGQSLLIYAIIFTVVKTIKPRLQGNYIYLLTTLPLLVSWRSILVMVSVLLLVLFLADNCKSWMMLFTSIILGTLSSAALLFMIAAVFYFRNRIWRNRNKKVIFCLAALATLTTIVIFVKFVGFSSGTAGYESEHTDNPVLSMLYRSTFIIKLIHGSLIKQLVYCLLFVAVGATTFATLVKPRKSHIDWLYIIALGGLFVEGMGAMVLAMLLVLKIGRMKVQPIANSPLSIKRSQSIQAVG